MLVFSDAGLGAMSRTYHRLYRTRLCRGAWRDRPRPVLINNWEATYFDFDADRIDAPARTAADLGIELLVLDDGWFGQRADDHSSLGDWDITQQRKLPGGLPDRARRVNAAGVRFGLWFAPEMVSRDSELYRQHPDWCLHVPGRGRSEGRNQLVMDFSRAEVRDAVYEKVAGVLGGLDPAANYAVTRLKDDLSTEDERSHGGDFLMAAGLPLPDAAAGDFVGTIWRLAAP